MKEDLDGSLRSPTLRVLDLFSGIGGFAIAFEAAGFETVAFAEIEPYPCKVLKQHWPQVPNLGDVRTINGEDFAGVDVVCGGFPCQPHSSAGLRLGEADPRNLWPEMARIIAGCRPSFVLAENVPALSDGFLDSVCADLEGIGYSVLPIEVPANAAGAPCVGNRLWILAAANGLDGLPWMAVQCEDKGQVFAGSDGEMRGLWLEAPPAPGELDYGDPALPDRVKAIGNGIVPAVAYPFAAWIASQLTQSVGVAASAEPSPFPSSTPL